VQKGDRGAEERERERERERARKGVRETYIAGGVELERQPHSELVRD
jgi:hypothetical protein